MGIQGVGGFQKTVLLVVSLVDAVLNRLDLLTGHTAAEKCNRGFEGAKSHHVRWSTAAFLAVSLLIDCVTVHLPD